MSPTATLLTDRYRLEERIAVGGVGEVWRGTDLVLERSVAVKLLLPQHVVHEETCARFRAEARRAGALSHPCITRVYDYCEDDAPHPPYLVLELVDGPSLAQRLTYGPLSAVQTTDVVAQVAEGLHTAHAAGMVHRDIKPANVLLSNDGRVKITDFGISHAAGSASVTGTGTLMGTPAYLAPERVAGATGTPSADLYSLGVVAYECLVGRPPFSGTPLEVAMAQRSQPLPPLPETVPPQVTRLVMELAEKDPRSRPASAGEVAQRARGLRDELAGSHTAQPAGELGLCPLTAQSAGLQPAPATHLPAAPGVSLPPEPPTVDPGTGPTHGWHGFNRDGYPIAAHGGTSMPRLWSPRRDRVARTSMVAAALAVALVAAIVGWFLAGMLRVVPAGQEGTPSANAAVRTIRVDAAALIGRRVASVRRELLRLGLAVHVVWRTDGHDAPGLVVRVHPTGAVPAGGLVLLTGSVAPPHPGPPGQRRGAPPGSGSPPGRGHGRSHKWNMAGGGFSRPRGAELTVP